MSSHPCLSPVAKTGLDFDPDGLRVVRFEYVAGHHAPGLLGLSVRTPLAWPDAARPTLLLQRDTVELLYSPRLVSTSRDPRGDAEGWLWQGLFGTPPELATDPGWLFLLRLYDQRLLLLPSPADAIARLPATVGRAAPRRAWPYAIRRGALLLIVTCQLSLTSAWLAREALADAGAVPIAGGAALPEAPQSPSAETPSEPVKEAVPPIPTGGSSEGPTERRPQGGPEPAPQGGPEPPQGTPSPTHTDPEPPAGAPQPSPSSPAPVRGASSSPSPSGGEEKASGGLRSGWRARRRPASGNSGPGGRRGASAPDARLGHKQRNGDGRDPVAHRQARSRHHPRRHADAQGEEAAGGPLVPGPAAVSSGPFAVPLPLLQLALGAQTDGSNPPAFLIPIYEDAGRRYHVPWRILAAINQIETDYGRDLSVSSAGAVGWMQFMPDTWRQWAVDADGDGQANPYSPMDAIFSAARYLQVSGASRDLPAAIYAYNHAAWYVIDVLLRARALERDLTSKGSDRGYALPLDKPYMAQLGRTDDGVDIETAPDGALVYSITPGIVTAVASDPGGFGPGYPVVEATTGSLAGQHIYYGHVAQALVQAGQRVAAGQPIGIVGHTGDAASLGHGHIEIGFSDAGGDPLSHHGTVAWTPAGAIMRSALVELSAGLGVHNS